MARRRMDHLQADRWPGRGLDGLRGRGRHAGRSGRPEGNVLYRDRQHVQWRRRYRDRMGDAGWRLRGITAAGGGRDQRRRTVPDHDRAQFRWASPVAGRARREQWRRLWVRGTAPELPSWLEI